MIQQRVPVASGRVTYREQHETGMNLRVAFSSLCMHEKSYKGQMIHTITHPRIARAEKRVGKDNLHYGERVKVVT